MTTKKSCKIRDLPTPKKAAYAKLIVATIAAHKRVRKLFRRTRGTKDEPLPPPHQWPAYGGTCWQAAYREAVAMRIVAETYQSMTMALNATYMPPNIRAMYIAAYQAAKVEYLAAWDGMEACLNGYPA